MNTRTATFLPEARGATTEIASLFYDAGADPDLDRPAHVRAGSALRRWGGRLVLVQDDANFLALITPDGIDSLTLPAGANGRRIFGDDIGNKADKWDLEAAVVLPDARFIAFGSGSRPVREIAVILTGDRVVEARSIHDLYSVFHQHPEFSGSELNIEGVVLIDNVLRFFQRGNGAPENGLQPVDATCDIPMDAFLNWLDHDGPPPHPDKIQPYDLGQVNDVRLTFTDACLHPDGRIVFLACAEASPNAYDDGEVVGCRVGIIDTDGMVATANILDPDGSPTLLKYEGIEASLHQGPNSFWICADVDHPDEPARFALMTLEGFA